jgi:Rieske Fe-S protein
MPDLDEHERTDAPACPVHAAPPPMDRRQFLVVSAGATLGASLLFVGATVVQAIMPPNRSIEGKTKVGKLAVAKVADLQVDVPKIVDYGDDVLFVIKASDTKINVLSASCPHVGCKLHFNATVKQFDCPCHASSFSIDGVKLGGPAPRNMFSATYEIQNGSIVVSGIQT